MKRFHFIDGIRGIACLMIVAHHSIHPILDRMIDYKSHPFIEWQLYRFTQSGVELFFVLSGVLLLRAYFMYDKRFKILTYLKRRVIRIWPSYLGALLFGAIVVHTTTFNPTWYTVILPYFNWDSLTRQLFIFNLNTRYFSVAWWSLEIEMVFYLLVPVIVYLKKINLTYTYNFLKIILLLILVSILFQLVLNEYYPHYYSLDKIIISKFRFVEYILCFYVGVYLSANRFTPKSEILIFFFGVVLNFIAFSYYEPLVHISYALIYGALISFSFGSLRVQNILSYRLLIWFGERSYSLFLVHMSVFYAVNYSLSYFFLERTTMYGILSRVIGLPMAIFIAMILFSTVERYTARGLVTSNSFWPWKIKMK